MGRHTFISVHWAKLTAVNGQMLLNNSIHSLVTLTKQNTRGWGGVNGRGMVMRQEGGGGIDNFVDE